MTHSKMAQLRAKVQAGLQFRPGLVMTHSSTLLGGENSVKIPNGVKPKPTIEHLFCGKPDLGANCKQVL